MFRPRIGVLFSRIRTEEKWVFSALEARGIPYERLDDSSTIFDYAHPESWQRYDAVLIRSLSYARGLYAARYLNQFGIPTVNMAHVAEICGDKLVTTGHLTQANIPQPRSLMAFDPESAMAAIETLGYPVVLKPVVGSWGRLLAKINDVEAAEAILEHKNSLGSYQHSIFCVQEYVPKPGRDIRAYVIGNETVCAIYRNSPHWITNTARGGRSEICPVTDELNELCVRAAQAVGGGMLGIDVIEHPEKGLLINEINHTTEFHNAAPTTGVDLPGMLVDYMLEVAGGDWNGRQQQMRYPVIPEPQYAVA